MNNEELIKENIKLKEEIYTTEDLKCLFFINQLKEKILYYNNNE